MKHFKKMIGLLLLIALSGCGSRAVYLQGGTICVLEKPVTVQASVPDSNGKLVPNTSITLPTGTEFKYSGK